MSSIRSASSRTRTRTWSSATAPRAIRSSSRPGVATRMSARLRGGDLGAEADAAVDGGDAQLARPGERLRARRRSARRARGSGRGSAPAGPSAPGSIRSTSGTPKASVLPEPVGDWTSRSWPASASRMTISWTGNGSMIERARSASTTDSEVPRSAKEVIWFSPRLDFLGDPAAPRHQGTRRKRNLSGGERADPTHSP